MDEKFLWSDFKNGDNEALSHLYKNYVHELFSYGMRIHGDNQLVKDCIQEVFIHLIENKKKILIADFHSAYLFKSLRNKLLEEVRTKNNRSVILKLITSDENTHVENIEQVTVKTEEEISRQRVIDAALGSLSNYQREAIFLKYSQGFDYEKIAEILGIDIASARTLIYRSLKKIKESVFNKIVVLFSLQFIRRLK